MTTRRFLVLGGGDGWHADQLQAAARSRKCELAFASYESLAAAIDHDVWLGGEQGPLSSFDGLLTRTMPLGSLEEITFRLAVMHEHAGCCTCLVNPPRSLELAIDKFATLCRIRRLGFEVPPTRVVQSRGEAINAFDELGGDCVIKPIFGGEGRGVMRVQDRELAWTTFSTLDQLGAVLYVQRFMPPGGRDTRLLVIGDDVFAVRRVNEDGFRTNVSGGAQVFPAEASQSHVDAAMRITHELGLKFASVDLLECADGIPRFVEVNGIPGWRGAQQVLEINVAEQIIDLLIVESDKGQGARIHAA